MHCERAFMFEKAGRFLADWRDRSGRRKRKFFTTAPAALKFEEDHRALEKGAHWMPLSSCAWGCSFGFHGHIGAMRPKMRE